MTGQGTDDAKARAEALDTTESFIVQAPAGSGKTELLIQRLLALLARVQHPEELVAITFTRKAAVEMKNRLLQAIRAARQEPPAAGGHQAKTWQLARAVVARDAELSWNLELEPERLRIDTVDALNSWLAQRLPLAAGAVAGLELVDDARSLYRLAARRTVAALADDTALGQSLLNLLESLDARLPRLEQLLADLAPGRDQWLRHIQLGADPDQWRKDLEEALERLVNEQLALLGSLFPGPSLESANKLLARPGRAYPGPAGSLEYWQSIAGLLLTKQGEWRRQVTAREGFPTSDPEGKGQFRALMGQLADQGELREALHGVGQLPAPRYDDDQWRHLAALRVVLPRLISELKVVFREAETCDFVEVALAAQQALGAADAPSDLLLALDRRIQHILVDEFQDTSHSQLELLEKLTAGWEPEDGRTLFLVGDPMQSIYRFRDADMSLFLRLKNVGIGDLRLRSLTLHRNFRSDPTVVEWVNRYFAQCMPADDDMARGAAAYVVAQAGRAAADAASVATHLLVHSEPAQEAIAVAHLVEGTLTTHRGGSVAVLVQGRGHLAGLQTLLRTAGIAAEAVEIEAPNQYSVIQDLIGLTRALLHPEDRIAWLALLRMPFCGVTLHDLAALCERDHKSSLWALLGSEERLAALSDDGRQRIQWLRSVLQVAFAERGDHGLAAWVERTWLRLGAARLLNEDEQPLTRRFFGKLAALSRNGDLDDPAELEHAFLEPEPTSRGQAGAQVQIMTVHRAKGLEFDTVIFMGLGREWPLDDTRGLRWLERINQTGGNDLLLAPLKSPTGHDALHQFIRREERTRDDLERTRLAYVAATRARDRLHLVGQLATHDTRPARRSMLARLWPAFADAAPQTPGPATLPAQPLAPQLRRVALVDQPMPAANAGQADGVAEPSFEWVSQTAVHVGTVAHRWLQRIAAEGAAAWSTTRVHGLIPHIEAELRLAGVGGHNLAGARERVLQGLIRTLEDDRGRWILDAGHREAVAEVALTLCAGAASQRLVIDRSFIDGEGIRWIIDYKISVHEGGGLEGFLDNEVERYRPQLELYARAMALKEGRPIRVGLYFPLLGAFRAWQPQTGPSEGA